MEEEGKGEVGMGVKGLRQGVGDGGWIVKRSLGIRKNECESTGSGWSEAVL